MSRTIHGLSHKALKAFRKKSAALPVYWIYVSRMNNEGVAWPSSAGLAKDTGWNKSACLDARSHLVSIGALEKVDGYVRPEWRGLSAQEKTRKVNVDRSEYYRPTGYVMHNGEKLPMLYNGGDEPAQVDEQSSDGKNGRTTERGKKTSDGKNRRTSETAVGQNGSTELDSSIELDSKKNTSINRPVFEAIAKGVFELTDLKGIKGGRFGQLETVAKRIAQAQLPGASDEYIAELVTKFARGEKFKPAIQGVNGFEAKFAAFIQHLPPRVVPDKPLQVYDETLDDGTPATPEKIEIARQMMADLQRALDGNSKPKVAA